MSAQSYSVRICWSFGIHYQYRPCTAHCNPLCISSTFTRLN